jgi:hypothetical protein
MLHMLSGAAARVTGSRRYLPQDQSKLFGPIPEDPESSRTSWEPLFLTLTETLRLNRHRRRSLALVGPAFAVFLAGLVLIGLAAWS